MTTYNSQANGSAGLNARPLHNGQANGATPPPPRRPVHTDDGVPHLPEDVNPILLDVLVGVVLIALYLFCTEDLIAAAPACVALYAVVLWRLSSRGRRIAGPVLAIATIMLFAAIARYHLALPVANAVITCKPGDLCMPVVLAAVLYYTRIRCYTVQILMFVAVAVLASGLLPGEGWLVVFLGVRYLFFLCVITGLLTDFLSSPHRTQAPMEAARA